MHAPKKYFIGFLPHDQRENRSDCPLFNAGDKAPDYRCSTSGRGVHGLRSSCVVGLRGDRRGWNVTPQGTRDYSSASDTESLELLAGKSPPMLVSQTSEGEQL